jgi:hypothetical protein
MAHGVAMRKFWTIVRYVLGGFFAVGAAAEVLDCGLYQGWTLQDIFNVCVGVLIAYLCFRPLLSKVEFGTLLRYVVGGYFALAGISHLIWTAAHADRRWHYLDITCVQFLIALACFWPLLAALYNKQKAKEV